MPFPESGHLAKKRCKKSLYPPKKAAFLRFIGRFFNARLTHIGALRLVRDRGTQDNQLQRFVRHMQRDRSLQRRRARFVRMKNEWRVHFHVCGCPTLTDVGRVGTPNSEPPVPTDPLKGPSLAQILLDRLDRLKIIESEDANSPGGHIPKPDASAASSSPEVP